MWIVREEQRPDFAAFLHRWLREQHERNLADADKPYFIALDEAQERIAVVILAGARLRSNREKLAASICRPVAPR